MSTGYTRQASANIASGLPIQSADINNELNQVQSAFNITTGHDHSGSAAGTGAKIALTTGISGILPVANGGTNNSTAYTAGSVIYSNGTLLTQDNANFFWDATNHRLAIGAASAAYPLDVTGDINTSTALRVGGVLLANRATSRHTIRDDQGFSTIILGKAADPTNYYEQTLHLIQAIGGATTFASFQASGSWLLGTNTNDNAGAGVTGEFISSEVAASAVNLTSTTAADLTSISLTAGDWEVWGVVGFIPAGTTVVTQYKGWVNTVSATAPTFPAGGSLVNRFTAGETGLGQTMPVGRRRVSINSTTTLYLGAVSTFTTSTQTAGGGIYARRMR